MMAVCRRRNIDEVQLITYDTTVPLHAGGKQRRRDCLSERRFLLCVNIHWKFWITGVGGTLDINQH